MMNKDPGEEIKKNLLSKIEKLKKSTEEKNQLLSKKDWKNLPDYDHLQPGLGSGNP